MKLCMHALMGAVAVTLLGAPVASADEPGLLFYQSGEHGLNADVAAGGASPTFVDQVAVREGGIGGHYIEASDRQVLAWPAPGNIYAERGTLSFMWRARHPAGPTAFPIFRVGYAEHTSWDQTWLRIDWNGDGFDAFVTDADLARLRVSRRGVAAPAPDRWLHLALAWDENSGVRFYVDGALVGRVDQRAMLDAGLSFFGPHSRIISSYQVQSAYNFVRGGDVDEIRIYDHALSADAIARLARNEAPQLAAAPAPTLADAAERASWLRRYGFERSAPPYLSAPSTRIRRVEFADARDVRQWMWRGNDGLRETTWPGVYNRSSLPGRSDYFILPDWNVYSFGGRAVTYTLPDEPWNRLEIQGAAAGSLALVQGNATRALGTRRAGQERTTHAFAETRGGAVKFENAVQEVPIQEIGAYYVAPGAAPEGVASLTYTVRASAAPTQPELDELNSFISGRFPAGERATVVALPDRAPQRRATAAASENALPIVHVLIPNDFRQSREGETAARFTAGWTNLDAGLDGIEVTIPALDVAATANGLYPLNIRVKDPLWPARDLLDINVSVRPREARTIFLDTRDRILPVERSLYFTIAGASAGLTPQALDGMQVRLVFKSREEAAAEHVHDRFQQVRDNWGYMIEERPVSRRYPAFERTFRDISDLLRVDPDHVNGRAYWAELGGAPPPPTPLAPPANGAPLWAARQVEALSKVQTFIRWWLDNRFVNGEMGGGLSDDTDFANQWPGLALMGVDTERLTQAHHDMVDAVYRNNMFTNGLSTIETDELHSYEDGVNAIAQALDMEWGDPATVERLMETARAYQRITEVNPAGHRHIVSSYFSGSHISRDSVWEWSKPSSYLILHPGMMLVEFNANPATRQLLLELADGYLAHCRQETGGAWRCPAEINWRSDEDRGATPDRVIQLMWAAYRWTGDAKYLRPIEVEVARTDGAALSSLNSDVIDMAGWRTRFGDALLARVAAGGEDPFELAQAFRMNGDISLLERLHTQEVQTSNRRMYVVTEGHMWSDRVELPSDELQRLRMGGVAIVRNGLLPGHHVSWRFAAPATAQSVGIAVREGAQDRLRIQIYNLDAATVDAEMTGWDVTAGRWTMRQGADTNGDGQIDGAGETREVNFARSTSVPLRLPARANTIVEMRLVTPASVPTSRPDVGIGAPDVRRVRGGFDVTVHSLGSVDAPAGRVIAEDASGREIATAPFATLAAPLDLLPKTRVVRLSVPGNAAVARVRLALDQDAEEITLMNNSVRLN